MAESAIRCEDCRFWLPSIAKDAEGEPSLSHYGACMKPGSSNWLSRRHKDLTCEQGELSERRISPHQT